MAGPERFTNIKQLKIQDTSDTLKIYFVGITNKFCKNNKYILSVFCLHMKCILSQQILPCCSRKAVDPEKQRAEHLKNILNLLNSVKNMRMRIEDDLDADSDPNENVLLVDV